MDTKLKNRHKLAVLLIFLTVLMPTCILLSQYTRIYRETRYYHDRLYRGNLKSEDFLETFLTNSYVLYYREDGNENERGIMETFYKEYISEYEAMLPYMDYQVQDEEGNVLEGYCRTGDSLKAFSGEDMEKYGLGVALQFDAEGKASILKLSGTFHKEIEVVLKNIINDPDYRIIDDYAEYENIVELPKNRTFYFGLEEEQLLEYMNRYYYYAAHAAELADYMIMGLMLYVCLAAFALPAWKSLHTGEEWLFRAPFEVVLCIAMMGIGVIAGSSGWTFTRENGYPNEIDFGIWFTVFAVTYWTAACVRGMFTMGLRRYWKERTWTYRIWKGCRGMVHGFFGGIRNWCRRQNDRLLHLLDQVDFKEKNNRLILQIVLANMAVLIVICCFWFFGIAGLLVYSALLFFLLQKYYQNLQEKYAILLKATGELAKGNLDAEIEGDLGIFSPFKEEIQKIQAGFQKAVKEEVKSQRMKTELITNVSHDLKTPLTAIITYVDLLKEEKDEEKRQNYIRILEQKSLRLKVLIEDLFEISKASSNTITLNLMDVDIVNLFKQVKLELEEKFREAGLEFRMNLPEEKLLVRLDSQKTYRIFETLLNNVAKYALKGTRVFVDILAEDEEVVIRMKNTSASELTFSPEEITDRFVRGDVSRNTEGSGLGLAIVKSFVEIQKGSFRIETEADLFKAEIRWPKA